MSAIPRLHRPADDPDPLGLTLADVARLTGLSKKTVERLADAGGLRCLRVTVPGSRHAVRVFRRSWVEEFIAAHTTGGRP